MLFRDKYKPLHTITPFHYVLRAGFTGLVSLLDIGVKPVRSPERFAFVVGCGHSGTTLLAARLGNIDAIFTVPEESCRFLPTRSLRATKRWLEELANTKAQLIVEKTPKHVHCFRRIQRLVPDPKIIAVVRNPLDTCASLKQRLGTLDLAIERYLMDTEAVIELRKESNVFEVKYEDFVSRPEELGRELLAFLNLEWDQSLITGGSSTFEAKELAGHMLKRKEQVKEPIRAQISTWKSRLSDEEAQEVISKTSGLALKLGYREYEYPGELIQGNGAGG